MIRRPPRSTLFPSPPLFRSAVVVLGGKVIPVGANGRLMRDMEPTQPLAEIKAERVAPGDRISDPKAAATIGVLADAPLQDRKSTRLNSSHANISYAVFCLKK